MLIPELPSLEKAKIGNLFDGRLRAEDEALLIRSGFVSFVPSDMDRFIQHFNAQVDEQESILPELWTFALRNRYFDELTPVVFVARLVNTANPLIFRSPLSPRPIIIMALGLLSFFLGAVFGVLNWAEGTGKREDVGKRMLVDSARAWVTNNPAIGPTFMDLAAAVQWDFEIFNYAVGLAHSAFTWAFLHEMGHFALGHLPTRVSVRAMTQDGTVTASSRTYDQNDEIYADAFGYDHFLGLMPFELELRRKVRIGPQIDHAPIIAFELMDLAFRLERRYDLLNSSSHPPPLERARLLENSHRDKLTDIGREFYAYWLERYTALRSELLK